jgi:hypothetical protein
MDYMSEVCTYGGDPIRLCGGKRPVIQTRNAEPLRIGGFSIHKQQPMRMLPMARRFSNGKEVPSNYLQAAA